MLVLAIETSCDETGIGIVRLSDDGSVSLLADEVASSVDEHTRFGGVVPEVASRAHLEALVRDALARTNHRERKGALRQPIKAFIQNVHHFRDEGLRRPEPPYDHVVIFDEAQRAWNRAKTADFMKRRKKIANFTSSEPEFLISYLDRHPDWAVIICLVGGGQEIHTGEAGIVEWVEEAYAATDKLMQAAGLRG